MVSDLFQGHKGVPTVERKVWVEPSGVSDDLSTVDMFCLHGPDMVSDLFQGHKGVPTVERKVWVEPSVVCCISYLCVDLLLICSICMDLTWCPTCFRATKGYPQWSARCGWSPVVYVASVIYLLIYYLLLICSICMDLTWFPTCFRATKGYPQWSARLGEVQWCMLHQLFIC